MLPWHDFGLNITVEVHQTEEPEIIKAHEIKKQHSIKTRPSAFKIYFILLFNLF